MPWPIAARWVHALMLTITAALCMAVSTPLAALPESGWWWNPLEPGRLYAIEAQGTQLQVAVAAWEEGGRSSWALAGPAVLAGDAIDSALDTYSGGPTLGGAYREAGAANRIGSLQIRFSSDTEAVLTLLGTPVPIERFAFAAAAPGTACAASDASRLFCSGFEANEFPMLDALAAPWPQAGFWRDADEPARRFFFEASNGRILAAAFVFDAAGQPVWYSSGPGALGAPNTSLEWSEQANGQTLTGPYRAPQAAAGTTARSELSFAPATRARRATLATAGAAPLALDRLSIGGSPQNGFPPCPVDPATPVFDTLPLQPDEFLAFRPLGFLSVPIHVFPAKHSAFSMTPPGQSAQPRPVRAPARAFVAEIYEASFSSTGNRNYQVYLYPCASLRVYFGHLATISERLLAAFNAGTPQCNTFFEGSSMVTTCRRSGLSVLLESGEVFGTGPDTAGVDFGVTDFRLAPAGFVRYEHWGYFYHYSASPLDYFTPVLRSQLEAETGAVFGQRFRTVPPIGGEFMQDLEGRAQGNWFKPGIYHSNSTDFSSALSLVHDAVDPSQPAIAAGNSIPGLNMGVYAYTPSPGGNTNRDVAAIRPDGTLHCIDAFLGGQSGVGAPLALATGALLIQMPTATTLRIERLPALPCPDAGQRSFSQQAVVFER